MLNFFKNLFGSGETETQAAGNGYAATAPAEPVQVRARHVTPQKVAEPPVARPAAAYPVAQPARPHVADGNSVQLPLYTVIAVLPLELKTRIRETMVADIIVNISLERVLTQLSVGAVRITFGELREMVPDVFLSREDLDHMEIQLPLNEILPQINPGMIARRQSQRHVHIPDDVQGPFGNDFSGVSLADPRAAAHKASMPAAVPHETKVPQDTFIKKTPGTAFTQKTPGTAFTQKPQPTPVRPVQPVRPAAQVPFNPPTPPAAPAPTAPPAAAAPIPFRSSISSTPTPRPPTAMPPASPPVRPVLPAARGVGATPLPAATPRLPAAPTNGNGNGRTPIPRPVPSVPVTPIAMAPVAPSAPAAPAAPAVPEVYLNVPMAVLIDSWPEVMRNEIDQLNLMEVQLALPARVVEPALKQGKVAFPWKVLRSWIRPAILPTVSAHDGMMLELPLRVIAPLFIARKKEAAHVQQKVTVSEKIPNLFFGFPQPDSPAPEPETPAVAPAAPASAPEAVEANFAPAPRLGVADTNFYVWNETGDAPQVDESEVKKGPNPGTDFMTRYATPNEVVARASALEGVVGALVALPDGLMVASKLSSELNGDTLAAFLPHIFGKVSQCTKELRMGELNNLHFTVGNVPWKIFRVNAIFFAAFGNAGQPLPTAQLAALAAQLDRKK